jgi:predicted nuclease of predicted toxin-antitoxin system
VKLLLDQNLSYKLCDALADHYPGSTQVRLIGLDRADDLTVWRHAAREGYMLVTQDTDVRDLAALHGAPPKVVLLRCGNKPTSFIERLLRDYRLQLMVLETAANIGLLEIG